MSVQILTGVAYIMFLGAFVYMAYTLSNKRSAERRFFIALQNILMEDRSDEDKIMEINLNYRKLSEYNNFFSRQGRLPEDLIERFVHLIDTGRADYLKQLRLELKQGARDKALGLARKMRNENPFASLPSNIATTMSNLRASIKSDNGGLGQTLLGQLAEQVATYPAALRRAENRNLVSYVISIVGVILTIVFGILAFAE